MEYFLKKDEYMHQFKEKMPQDKKEREELNEYLAKQFEQLNYLISTVSPENFWEKLPRVLSIDAKLTLITELIQFEEALPINVLLRIVETNYRMYFKERFDTVLSKNNKYSMIYNVV